jgi:hypothetical protein
MEQGIYPQPSDAPLGEMALQGKDLLASAAWVRVYGAVL